MTLKSYLLIMSGLTAVCWGIFVFVIGLIDPEVTNWLGFSLFFLSLFAALSGTTAIIGFLLRFVALKRELAFNAVRAAFRQSFLFSLFVVLLLILKIYNLYTWPNLFLLLFIFVLIELFLTGRKKPQSYDK